MGPMHQLIDGKVFVLSPLADGTKEKRALFNKLKSENAEGIVFKRRKAAYTSGRPASGGNQIKFKFVATASFVVMKVNKKRSVAVGLYDDNKPNFPIDVGNVTIPPNKDVPKKDQIIEVQYLYAYKGGSIYQPVYLGVRDDIDREACLMSQLKYKQNASDEEVDN